MATVSTFGACECSTFSCGLGKSTWPALSLVIRVPKHVFLFRHRQYMHPLALLLSVYEYSRYNMQNRSTRTCFPISAPPVYESVGPSSFRVRNMQNQSTRTRLPISAPPVYESVGPSSFRVWISSVRYAKSEYQITSSYSDTASIWIRWAFFFPCMNILGTICKIRVPDHIFLFRHRQYMNPLGLLLSVYEYPRYDMQNFPLQVF